MPTFEQETIREALVRNLSLDLLGPSAEDEVLRQDRATGEGDSPLTRYLLGILYPSDSLVDPEEDDFANDATSGDEDDPPEPVVPITGIPKPSSLGLSFAVVRETPELEIEFRYGVYVRSEVEQPVVEGQAAGDKKKPVILWTRTQVAVMVRLTLPATPPNYVELPSGGRGEWLVRDDGGMWVVSVFLRNTNPPVEGPDDPEDCLYQPEIIVRDTAGRVSILNRADRFNQTVYDPDLESYRLLYRDKPEFAVGHGCATAWDNKECPPDRARAVTTDLLPSYTVTATEAKGGVGLAGLDMAGLAQRATELLSARR